MKNKIYKVEAGDDRADVGGYDQYKEFVVICDNEFQARHTEPGQTFPKYHFCTKEHLWLNYGRTWAEWENLEFLRITLIGETDLPHQIVMTAFIHG